MKIVYCKKKKKKQQQKDTNLQTLTYDSSQRLLNEREPDFPDTCLKGQRVTSVC